MSHKFMLMLLLSWGAMAQAQTADREINTDTLGIDPVDSLQEVVITANREGVKRSEAPIAITSINARLISYTKPASIDQLLNKVSGVNMVSLGNEQHQMSIRQPMTTRSLFLYLEDGIPIRTSGIFNHNALLEMNMAAVKNIEVIRGPSSSLYGSEAIGGVVNFITYAPSDNPDTKLSIQGNNIGYNRTDFLTGFSKGKLGVTAGGYYADKRNSYLEFTDYHKGTFTVRADYRLSNLTTLSNSITITNYYSDMPGGIDSAMFAGKVFRNLQSFTYRKVNALRYHISASHNWSKAAKTSVSLIYRDNSIEQNPAYRITDDYRKQGGVWKGEKNLAHGEINKSSFNSYAFIGQHRQQFKQMRAVLIGGISIDASPSAYAARYIRITKDSNSQKYTAYQETDSILTDYSTRINNYAGFINAEFSPVKKLRIVSSIRYDLFRYVFNNHSLSNAFSGSQDTINTFKKLSSKVGATYNFSAATGLYANYSEGFIPPQVTEMYTGVKVPSLIPSVVRNYEAGGWFRIINNKLTADISAYILQSTNEVISTRLDDGSFANKNAGRTSHKGVEASIHAKPSENISIRFSGAYSKHRFVHFIEKGKNYNGNEMNDAPNWMYNTEIWYTPSFIKGLRAGIELQHIGKYFTDPENTSRYNGYTIVNVRAGYQYHAVELWINVLNATDRYYANIVTKSAYGYSYTVADPVSVNIGCSYNFSRLQKNK